MNDVFDMETSDPKVPQSFHCEVFLVESNLLETDAQKLESCNQIITNQQTTKETNKDFEQSPKLDQSHLNSSSSSLVNPESNLTFYLNEDLNNQKCNTKELQKLSSKLLEKHSGVRIDSLALNNSQAFIGKKLVKEFETKNIIVVLSEDPNNADGTVTKNVTKGSKVHLFCTLFYKRLIFVLFSVLFACSFAFCGTYMYLHMRNSGSEKSKEIVSRNITVVDLAEWGAIPETVNQICCPLKIVNWVLLHTLQQSEICTNQNDCSKQIESYQHYYDKQFVKHDRGIRENFIIGGDEQIYIGRGWKTVKLSNNVKIGILLGNLQYTITNKQIYLAQVLMNVGRRCGKITDSFLTSWRCGFCKQYGDVAKILDLSQEGIFRVNSVVEFVEDTDILSRRLCQRGEVRDQLCREVRCSRHFSSSCVWCNTTSRY